MTQARISQAVAETLRGNATAQAQVSQAVAETLRGNITAQARASQVVLEVLRENRAYIVPVGIASAEAVGTPTVSYAQTITGAGGIATAEAMGTPSLHATASIFPSGIVTGEAFGSPAVALEGGNKAAFFLLL